MCVSMLQACMPVTAHMEVRGQFVGIDFLSYMDPGNQAQIVDLSAEDL